MATVTVLPLPQVPRSASKVGLQKLNKIMNDVNNEITKHLPIVQRVESIDSAVDLRLVDASAHSWKCRYKV